MIKPFLAFASCATLILTGSGFYPRLSLAQQNSLGILKSKRIQAIHGLYEGEIRFQSSNGLTDQLIQPHSSLLIQVQSDTLELKNTTDLLGAQCQSKLGEILELKTFSEQDSRVLMAEFAFHSGKCFEKYRAKSLTLIIWQNDRRELIAETLLKSTLGLDHPPKQNLFVHGYFTQSNPPLAPNRAPAVAQSGTM